MTTTQHTSPVTAESALDAEPPIPGDDPRYPCAYTYRTVTGEALSRELPSSEQAWRALPPTLSPDELAG